MLDLRLSGIFIAMNWFPEIEISEKLVNTFAKKSTIFIRSATRKISI